MGIRKKHYLKDEDYWVYLVGFFNVLFGALAIYAVVIFFRGPAVVLSATLAYFTYKKLKRDYGPKKAVIHLFLLAVLSIIFAYWFYLITD